MLGVPNKPLAVGYLEGPLNIRLVVKSSLFTMYLHTPIKESFNCGIDNRCDPVAKLGNISKQYILTAITATIAYNA